MVDKTKDDDITLEGYSEEDLERILESDDPDEMYKMLQGAPKSEDAETGDDDAKTKADASNTDDTSPEAKATDDKDDGDGDKGDGADSSGTDGDDSGTKADESQNPDAYIETKDGKHKIPYSVLEATRAREQETREQLEAANKRLQELEGSSKKMADVLKDQGIDLESLQTQGQTLSDEQLAAIKDADPDIANAIGFFQQQLQAQAEELANLRSQQTNEQVTPLELAIRSNNDLNTWRSDDPDRWTLAVRHDNLLREHPEWKDRSMDDRFAEAVRLTKMEFGDPLPNAASGKQTKTDQATAAEIAERKLREAESRDVPRSLSSVGKTPSTDRSLAERLSELDGDQLVEELDKLSPDKVNEVLAELG